MKKLISLLLCLVLLALLPFSVMAAENQVIDEAGLLFESEIRSLNDQIHTIKDEYAFDIAIVTTWDLDGLSAQAYADNFYDEHGYGCGDDRTGVLLLVDMGSRQWYISTCGEAIFVLDDTVLEVIGEDLVSSLSSGDYYGGFEFFVYSIPKYIGVYQQGDAYNTLTPPPGQPSGYVEEDVYYPDNSYIKSPLIAIVIGFVASLITILIMLSTMNTAKAKHSAPDYVKQGSYHLNIQRDIFLYSRTSRTRKQQNTSSGGSSVHRSSGGVSHGGRGGRF